MAYHATYHCMHRLRADARRAFTLARAAQEDAPVDAALNANAGGLGRHWGLSVTIGEIQPRTNLLGGDDLQVR